MKELSSTDFIVALLLAEKITSCTLKLSKTEAYDLAGATSYAESIISPLSKTGQNVTRNSLMYFKKV